MAIDFPASPTLNQEYSFEGRTWRWNGTGWEVKEYPAALLAGTAANPSLYFSGDPNTGLYSPGADQVAISTGGTGRLFVDSSGRVGIGTSSPGSAVDVISASAQLHAGPSASHGLIVSCTDTTFGRSAVVDNAGFAAGINLYVNNNGEYAGFHIATTGVQSIRSTRSATPFDFRSAGDITLSSANAERARIDSSGRLLVGASSEYSFTNGNGTTSAPRLQVTGDSAGSVEFNSSLGLYNFASAVAGSRASSIGFAKSRGVGIGTQGLVNSGDRLGEVSFHGSDGTAFRQAASIDAFVDGTPGANDMPGRLVFSTTTDGAATPTEAMRINNQRELLIGTTTRTANGGVLQVSNGITFPGTQSACSDANTLDDYEEGTWTVGFFDASSAGNQSATTGTGTYTKVGRLVTCNFEVDNVSTSGLATTTNPLYFSLPFTPLSTGPASTNGVSTLINVAGSTSYVRATVFNYLSRGAFYLNSTTLTYPVVRVSDVTSASNRIGASFFYYV